MSINDQLREHLLTWLRANDIDPADISSHSYPSLVDDQLTVDVFVRDAEGRLQFDPIELGERNQLPARTARTFTITVPPPAEVADWLRPRCPTCGR